MLDCTDVNKLIEDKADQRGGFILLALLTKLQLDCLREIQDESRGRFPKKQEKILLKKINDQVKKLKADLILLDPKDLKFIGLSLLDYNVEGNINFNKFLVESLLSSYRSIKEEINQQLKAVAEKIEKADQDLKKIQKNEGLKDKPKKLQLQNDKLKNLESKKNGILKFRNFNENELDKFTLGLDSSKDKVDKYLEVRRDVDSLYKIHSTIESLKQSLKGNKISIEEKRLALQRVFHITGEYLKDTETTPNLLSDVRQSLEETGIPTKLLSKFRDTLAHYHVFPFIEADDEKIQQLFDEGFLSIQRIVEDRIIEREESLIQRVIEENESKIKDKSVVEQLKESISNEGVRGLEKYIRTIKSQPKYRSMDNESKKLVDEIYQNALQMKSMGFSANQGRMSVTDHDEIKSQISGSITEYVKQSKLKQNKVEVYERLYNKLDLDNLDNAHNDVLKITKVIDLLRGEDTASPNNNIFDDFLDMRVLGEINISKDLSLKKELEKYFDANSFKNNDVYYYEFKGSNPSGLINLLNSNISGTNDNKSKLIKFFESISVSQDNESNYIPPDEYEKLVGGLKIGIKDKEKLLLYSVEWRKKKCIDLLKKNPPALKKIYDSIMEGEAVKEPVYESLASQYPHETSGSLNQMISEKIEKFYLSRIYEEFDVLGKVKNPYAVEAQIVNIYALLEKAKGSQEEIFKVKKLRNYLSHGDALTSDKDDKDIAEDLVKLKDDIVRDLVKLKDEPPSEVKGFKITLQKIERAIDDLQSHVSLEGKKRIIQLLCPIGSASKNSLHFGGARRRRSAIESCLTWEEIDKFNEGGPENRDPDNIIIDSEKFLSSISNKLDANEEKFSNFIALASESEVMGGHKNKVNMLTDNHRYLGHLERVGKVSGIVMHGMIAKNVAGDLLRGDYEDVAINLGFLAGSQGLAKVAEAASMKGAGYILEGRALLGKSLKFASPFLSRGVSAFVAYDLYNQVKEYEKGNKDALVPIIGDSLQLGVDSVELGIEIGEVLGLESLEGVSAVTGPIGMAIGAIVFVGTDVYTAVRTVEKIDEQIHLTGWEKVTEGTRAFFGLQPSEDVEKLIEEKEANNQAVKSTISFFEGNPYIQRYVFPSIKIIHRSNVTRENCSLWDVIFPFVDCKISIIKGNMIELSVFKYIEKTEHIRGVVLNNVALLDQKRNDIKWSRTRPDNLEGVDLFCLPKGDSESVPENGTYYCDGAIGVEYANNRTGNYTLISLGDGEDRVKGFQDSSNIFVLGDGHKNITGGNKDDNFIFHEKSVNATYDSEIKGFIDGSEGIDTIDVGGLTPHYNGSKGIGQYQVFADFRQGILKDTYKVAFYISNINQFLGRKGRVDQVVSACDTKHVDGKGGENKNYLDSVIIPKDDACSYHTKVIVNPYTKVTNNATSGNFIYFIKGEKEKEAYVDLGPNSQSSNTFAFNYTLKDVAAIDKSEKNITFSFVEEFYKREKKLDVNSSFNLTVSGADKSVTTHRLIDSTKIVMGQNNVYAMQNTKKPIDSLVKDYSSIADKLQMYVVVHSNNEVLTKNEVLTVGHSYRDVLMNDPNVGASHLVGNGGENVFVITSGHEKLISANLPISDVIIYDFDQENKIDTLDLRKIKEQLKKDIDREINTEVSKIDSDLLINLSLDDESKTEVVKVKLKGALENNWYKRVHIVMDSIFVIEEILDDFELTPQPLIFDDNNKTIYVINPKDVVKGDKIRVKKEIGDYTFACDNDALVITNSLSSSVDKNNLFTVILNDFYHENNQDKMQTLKIEFNDKKIFLRKEIEGINSARNFSELKRKAKIDSYKVVMYEIKKQKLFEAIKENNTGEVRDLINNGVSIDARNNEGQTPLHYAAEGSAENSNLEVVRYLVEKKSADVNVKNAGQTPLHYAAKSGNLRVVEYLIEKGADFNVNDAFGKAPLHYAAKSGNLEIVKYLIKQANLNANDAFGKSPLHYAAEGGNLEVVKYLIEERTDFNVSGVSKDSLLICAAEGGSLEVVKYFEDKRFNFNIKDYIGRKLLHFAAKSGSLEVADYLIAKKNDSVNITDNDKRKPLHYAALGGSLNVVKYLVEEKKVSLNITDAAGREPLHYAALGGSLNVVKYLVEEEKADINVTDNYPRETSLHYAAEGGNLEVVKYLVEEEKADINVTDSFRRTSLHYAAKNGNLEVVKYLIEKEGDNINVKDNDGQTPLHYAASHVKLKVVKYLIEKGAKIDLEVNGEAPWEMLERRGNGGFVNSTVKELTERLFDAVKYGDFSEVQNLINQGVSTNVKNSDGQTLLHYAAEYSKLKLVKYLIEKKEANFNVTDNFKQTPLYLAAMESNIEVVKYLIKKGAEVDLKVNDKTLLGILEGKGYEDVVDSIIKKLAEKLFDAVKYGDFDKIQDLVNQRVSVNIKDSGGQALLHSAAYNSKLEVVKYLIEKNATVDVRDVDGRLPLHYAAEVGNLNVVKYLVEEKSANVTAEDNYKAVPLHFATFSGNLELVKYLIEEKHVNISATDNAGKTPLHTSSAHNLSVVDYLIKKGTNVNVRDNFNQTLLHFVALGGNLSAVKHLIEEKRADVNLKNKSGETPLYLAVSKGNLKLVEYLVENGADVNLENNSGWTPLRLAKFRGCTSIVEYLEKLEGKRPAQRKRRHHYGDRNRHHSSHRFLTTDSSNQQKIATSNASQKSSWINDLVGWVKNSIGKLSPKPEKTSSTASSMPQVDMQIDADGTIMLLDLLIRKVTGRKYISSSDQNVPLMEAQGYALNIIEEFEKVLNETAIKSGISAINLNFNPLKPQSAIVGQIRNGKFSEISKTLYSFAKEACSELEQTDKFLVYLKSCLEEVLIEKEAVLLQQKVEQASDQKISRKVVGKELPKKPDTLLNGISVVEGINNVLVL